MTSGSSMPVYRHSDGFGMEASITGRYGSFKAKTTVDGKDSIPVKGKRVAKDKIV
jgi:hypothetical protein